VQWWQWLVISLGVIVVAYAAFLAWLAIRGRREDARALATWQAGSRAYEVVAILIVTATC
jgi:hypothetical protein